MKFLFSFFSLTIALLFQCKDIFAQVNPGTRRPPVVSQRPDSLVPVEILPNVRRLEFRKIDDSTQLQILAGNVRMRQGNTLFSCDSCVINNRENIFEAWGNVHIVDSDTADVKSNHLRYLIKQKLAYLDGNVRLTDGNGTLTTPSLEYDVDTKIGIYKQGGRVVNKKTVLTSREGYYYTDLKEVYFKNNVVLVDPAYTLKTDSLLYSTELGTARFIAYTLIKDSSGRTIETSEGFYNLNTGQAEFGRRPVITDGKTNIKADEVRVDDKTNTIQARGNVVVIDSVQNTTLLAGEVFRNNKTEAILATRRPLLIIKQDNDSIYVTADTLFSARLSDLRKSDSLTKDTLTSVKVVNTSKTDSTNRYFEAFRNVKIFSDSVQAVSDSLFYSFKDSTFRMYYDPVIWSRKSQVTGDTVYLFTKNRKADRFQVINNSFLVNNTDPGVYNQVKSSRMDGFFREGNIDSVRARGFAECIYFIQDDDGAYTGINETKCDIMDIYFRNQEVQKVVFRSAVTGTLWPISQKNPAEMRLENFRWLESRRPKTKFELF